MMLSRLGLLFAASSIAGLGFAAPMPTSIVVEDKAVVPVLKIETIRTIKGQAPERHVQATVFEVSQQGKEIIAREITLSDHQAEFSEAQLSIPVIKKGGVIVPTSKIELNTTLKQNGEVFAKTKEIDAEGVEFKKDGTVVKRQLKLGQVENEGQVERSTHVLLTENGETTRDMVIVEDKTTDQN